MLTKNKPYAIIFYMIGIVVALKKEAEKTISLIKEVKITEIAQKKVYEGTLFDKKVVLILSGIGKVNAAIATQILIDKYNVEFIFNYGTAGGIDSSVKICSYYAVESACQFDFDLRDIDGVPLGYIQDFDTATFPANTHKIDFLEKKKLASADRFTESKKDTDDILSLGCNLRDMEGGAIAEVCFANKTPLCIIKGVSDVVGSNSTSMQYYQNAKNIGDGFPEIIKKVIENA